MTISDEQNFLPPQTDWITGNKITDPAWLKWFHNVGNMHKSIKFVNVVGDLDDIDDGTTYGKVNITVIDASGIVILSQCSGDIDDIGDGTSYAKVLKTDISAGHILLSSTVGDLDDIDDGTSYGKVALTSISAGKIIVAGLGDAVKDSYGPIIADPTFALTQSSSDSNYWDQSDAQVTWATGDGESGPGLRISGNSETNTALAFDGSGNWKYTPCSHNDKILVQVRIWKDADFDGTAVVRVYERDESKTGITAQNLTITPTAASTWETKTVQCQPANNDTHFVAFGIRVGSDATQGRIQVDSVYVILEPASNFRHSSDVTKIDGGTIYTGTVVADAIAASTITAAKINGAGFGTLTITSGTIEFNAANSLVIKASGNMQVQTGGSVDLQSGTDLKLYGSTTNPSIVAWFDPASNAIGEMGSQGNGHLDIVPSGASKQLNIGKTSYVGGSPAIWSVIDLRSSTQTYLIADDTSEIAAMLLDADVGCNLTHYDTVYGYSNVNVIAGEVTINSQGSADLKIIGTTVRPSTDKGLNLGHASYRFDEFHVEDIVQNGGYVTFTKVGVSGNFLCTMTSTGSTDNNYILKLDMPGDSGSAADRFIQCENSGGSCFTVDGTGAHASSSRSQKENIVEFNDSLIDKLRDMSFYNYNFKWDRTKTLQMGAMSDDLEILLPHIINSDKMINLLQIIFVYGKILQELYVDKFLTLEARVDELTKAEA